jgi:hypothetical protein
MHTYFGPSFSTVSNARAIAAMSNLVANGGKNAFGKQIISKETVELMWSDFRPKLDEAFDDFTEFSKGGLGWPVRENISYFARGEKFFGWTGKTKICFVSIIFNDFIRSRRQSFLDESKRSRIFVCAQCNAAPNALFAAPRGADVRLFQIGGCRKIKAF